MATPMTCDKCHTNTWKISVNVDTYFFTCAKCGNIKTFKPPTIDELFKNNKEQFVKYIKKLVEEQMTESKVSERVEEYIKNDEKLVERIEKVVEKGIE